MNHSHLLKLFFIIVFAAGCEFSTKTKIRINDVSITEADKPVQDSLTALNESWNKLKTELKRRSDLILNLTKFNSSSKANKEKIDDIRAAAINFIQFADSSTILDSITIKATYQRSLEITQKFGEVLKILIEDPKHKDDDELRGLQSQLEGIENRIEMAKRNYNSTCTTLNRPDLLFEQTTSGD